MSFLLTLLLLVPPDVFSQDQIYEWSTFRREQGLLHNYVTAIVEGPDGAIWFGGAYGLSRYDGDDWTHYTEKNGLPGGLVTHLMIDGNGRPWAASGEGFRGFRQGWVAYLKNDAWVPLSLEGDRRRLLVGALFELDGAAAVGTRGGGLFIQGSDGHVTRLIGPDGPTANDIECAVVMEDGSALVVHGMRGRGPSPPHPSFRDQNGAWSVWDPGPLSGMDVVSVASDARGHLWFGTANKGLWWFDSLARSADGTQEPWAAYTTEDGLPSNTIDVLATAPDGTVWVGTPMGVAKKAPGEVEFERFSEKDALPSTA